MVTVWLEEEKNNGENFFFNHKLWLKLTRAERLKKCCKIAKNAKKL